MLERRGHLNLTNPGHRVLPLRLSGMSLPGTLRGGVSSFTVYQAAKDFNLKAINKTEMHMKSRFQNTLQSAFYKPLFLGLIY